MKKLAFVLFAGLCFATTANAQLQFGVKAGANISNVSGNGVSNTSSLVGFNGGVYLGLGIADHLYLQPELMYSGEGFKESESGFSATQSENYINIPILVKYEFPMGLYAQTGPQVGFLMSAKAKSGGASQDDKSSFKSIDFGWALGAGFKIPSTQLSIDARYIFGLANIVDNSQNGGGTNYSVKNGVFQVGLAYTLFSTEK